MALHVWLPRLLTFELRRGQRQSARPGGGMINLTWSRAWRFAVGPRLERGVRRRWLRAPDWKVQIPSFSLLAMTGTRFSSQFDQLTDFQVPCDAADNKPTSLRT